ncbi:2-aminoethylphosphonate--pyruvate transaminase [Hahella sp. CCB-MM4]|uniref:2-aminoethylphosphonate--pyruvate transaminase n=1 Tax=Hahella sp. (strain CCB-MM4) TaxID=1926491 RepID=UPI000B9A6118|nr:2-aminoethylphosphonate--pyruvate transaminase [Hahella sp. CCB-MM4]OZG70954.1 2-aminoethylphosphonate--pyruvate transaminase [Hahella sp. CCB-MM4]
MNQPKYYLLTPGPITTTYTVKEAMLTDWGSWDDDFNQVTQSIRSGLLKVANAETSHVCVPLQGSGTFAVEATLGTLLGPNDKLLVLMNGAYGQRIAKICDYLKRPYSIIDTGDYLPPDPEAVRKALQDDPAITTVALVHCETSSGILNPVEAVAGVVKEMGRKLIIDSMSAFGALPVNAEELPFDALISSANKCFEGVPGFGFSLIRRDLLENCKGNAHSLSMDLYDQWAYMEKTGQWRYTPPTHTVAAFAQAMREHAAEGGTQGRLARYTRNRDQLVAGMRKLGFKTLLEDIWLSPIIVTFISPDDPAFEFKRFYAELKKRGFVIYPGKLTQMDSFRIGCIGQIDTPEVSRLLSAIQEVLSVMQVNLSIMEETLS